MGLFSRNKRQANMEDMEKDLVMTEEQAEFTIETPVSNLETTSEQPAADFQENFVAEQPAAKESQNWLNDYEGAGQLTIDVYQTDDSIVIKSTIAGVRPEDLDVVMNGDMLMIRGTRKKGEIIPEENYFYQECYWGDFARSVILPAEVKAEKIEAELKDGILTVTLPKAQKDKTRKIMVKAAR